MAKDLKAKQRGLVSSQQNSLLSEEMQHSVVPMAWGFFCARVFIYTGILLYRIQKLHGRLRGFSVFQADSAGYI